VTEYNVCGLAGGAGFGSGEVCDVTVRPLPEAAEPELAPIEEAAFEDDVEPLEADAPLELAEIFETVVEVLVEAVAVLAEAAPGSGANGLREAPRRCWEAPLVVSATARPAPG
jgi:hypothetical protein